MRLSSPAGLPCLLELCCRVIETDEDGTAWIGSEAGNVKRVELKTSKLEGGGARQWLEPSTTLKWRKVPIRTDSSGAAIASSSGGSTAVAVSGELAAEAGDPGGPAGAATLCCRQTCDSTPFCCAQQPLTTHLGFSALETKVLLAASGGLRLQPTRRTRGCCQFQRAVPVGTGEARHACADTPPAVLY